jgi:hypothetical protein
MRYLPRLLLNAAAGVSLLLALVTLALWAAGEYGVVARVPLASRYTFSAHAGTLTLHRQSHPAAIGDTVRQRIAYLRNGDLTGTVTTHPSYGVPRTFVPRLDNRSLWANYPRAFASAEYDAALVAALDDPERFAAAHLALVIRRATRTRTTHFPVSAGAGRPPTGDR